ncbi:MAG: cysteine desulfurase [Schleiferiaceae bacterium]|nr:cysteine desulfurase [Schleiferiaceae bacterium]
MVKEFNIAEIREAFPILHQEVNGKPLVYLDNGATVQKPKAVIDAISNYYETINANVHRGVHSLSQWATDAMEGAREKVRAHINAPSTKEIIFTSGTTDSINIIASSFTTFVGKEDEIIISAIEHHSNIVPWQMLCERTGATLKVIPVLDNGELDQDTYAELLSAKTKMVAFNHISNSLGTINPVKEMIAAAHEVGAAVLIDGAQALPHLKVDVQDLDADFYAFSGHKMYAPTGVGVLFGKEEWLNKLPPYRGGGEMIATVTFEKSTYASLPHKFEAGTPNVAGNIALGAAIDFMNEIGLDAIASHESELVAYATEKLMQIEGMKIYGIAKNKAGVISFNIDGVHNYDLGVILDKLGIAVRTGHHCTQPIMDRFGIAGTARASFGMYNTKEDIDKFIAGVERAKNMLL